MGFAEKKAELLRIIEKANEEQTGRLIEFAKTMDGEPAKFSEEELARFHATRQKHADPSAKTILMEDAHTYIRNLKAK